MRNFLRKCHERTLRFWLKCFLNMSMNIFEIKPISLIINMRCASKPSNLSLSFIRWQHLFIQISKFHFNAIDSQFQWTNKYSSFVKGFKWFKSIITAIALLFSDHLPFRQPKPFLFIWFIHRNVFSIYIWLNGAIYISAKSQEWILCILMLSIKCFFFWALNIFYLNDFVFIVRME